MNYDTLSNILLNEPIFMELGEHIHNTNKVINEYVHLFGNEVNEDYFIGLSACYFHEIGKTKVKIDEWSFERVVYSEFPNFETISSRLAEDIMVRYEYTPMQIYRVCWLIQMQNEIWLADNIDQWSEIFETVTRYIGWKPLRNFMIVSSYLNYNTVDKWDDLCFTRIHHQPRDLEYSDSNKIIKGKQPPRVYFPIAASASGKSTICEQILGNVDYLKTRYDSLRKELYSDNGRYDYWHCIMMSYQDSEWNSIADDVYIDMIQSGKTILYDNCNVLRSDRTNQITIARKHGYEVIALTIPIDLVTLKYRQDHRRTKLTPWQVSKEQYMELQQPSCSNEEFDYIIPLDYR